MTCLYCGAECHAAASFCTSCGKPLGMPPTTALTADQGSPSTNLLWNEADDSAASAARTDGAEWSGAFNPPLPPMPPPASMTAAPPKTSGVNKPLIAILIAAAATVAVAACAAVLIGGLKTADSEMPLTGDVMTSDTATPSSDGETEATSVTEAAEESTPNVDYDVYVGSPEGAPAASGGVDTSAHEYRVIASGGSGVYSAPAYNADIIGSLNRGEEIYIQECRGDWAYMTGPVNGWVPLAALCIVGSEDDMLYLLESGQWHAVVETDEGTGVNMREGPGTQYPIVCGVAEDETVTLIDFEPGWCYVEYRGRRGWICSEYLII